MNPQDQIENPMLPWDFEEEEKRREKEEELAEAQIDQWMDKKFEQEIKIYKENYGEDYEI